MRADTRGRPGPGEAAPYYFTYIDRITDDDIVETLSAQHTETLRVLRGISDERSRHRYASDKWSIRQVVGHINDTERVFSYRALWFARGFTDPLGSFDQTISVTHAESDAVAWSDLVAEFDVVRQATVALFENLPTHAWSRGGTASGKAVTVRALAYIIAGHTSHHLAILEERYGL
jgi:hypothetical protein